MKKIFTFFVAVAAVSIASAQNNNAISVFSDKSSTQNDRFEKNQPIKDYRFDDNRSGGNLSDRSYDNTYNSSDDRNKDHNAQNNGYSDRNGDFNDRNGGYNDRNRNFNDRNGGSSDRNGNFNDRKNNYNTGRDKDRYEAQRRAENIARINRDYDQRILVYRNDRRLSQRERDRRISEMNGERNVQLKSFGAGALVGGIAGLILGAVLAR